MTVILTRPDPNSSIQLVTECDQKLAVIVDTRPKYSSISLRSVATFLFFSKIQVILTLFFNKGVNISIADIILFVYVYP
jgi:hypothetical protein